MRGARYPVVRNNSISTVRPQRKADRLADRLHRSADRGIADGADPAHYAPQLFDRIRQAQAAAVSNISTASPSGIDENNR